MITCLTFVFLDLNSESSLQLTIVSANNFPKIPQCQNYIDYFFLNIFCWLFSFIVDKLMRFICSRISLLWINIPDSQFWRKYRVPLCIKKRQNWIKKKKMNQQTKQQKKTHLTEYYGKKLGILNEILKMYIYCFFLF